MELFTNQFLNKSPIIMGVLNVTPDSFSDGGQFNDFEKAVARALEMEKQGADIIDIGGESTGPGSKEVSLAEELARTIPVIKSVREKSKIKISIDTYKGEVARQALKAGADIVNDVTALRGDKEMVNVIAEFDCPIVLMYAKDNSPRTTISMIKYGDVIATIKHFFDDRLNYAYKFGINKENIIIDPGMGQFISSNPKYSFEIIDRLAELQELGQPILIGLSRKSFLGGSITERDKKALPLTVKAIKNGAKIIRTHDVVGVLKELHS